MGEPLQLGNSAAVRPLRRWIRRAIRWSIPVLTLIGVVVLVVRFVALSPRELDCAAASRTGPGVAAVTCQREYERTRQPQAGIYLADALRRTGNRGAASALATGLLGTELRGDALQILGKIAKEDGRIDDAVTLLQQARRVHRDGNKRVELAKDDVALAQIHSERNQYAEALEILDECIGGARAATDPRIEGYCHLTAARALMDVGYFEQAHQELDRAAQQLSDDRDLAEVWYWRGNLEQEVVRDPLRPAHHEQAVADFERSLELKQRAQTTEHVVNLHLNLGFTLAELGRTEQADRHLAEAGVLDRDGQYASQRAQLAARIAWRRGNLTLAYALNERAYPNIQDHDEQIDVCVMQARIALATNDPEAAALWARRGVDAAEEVRAAQTLRELRPWALASRREPFEVLFTVLAHAHHIEDAIVVFDRWQGRTMLEQMARPSPDPTPGLSSTATRILSLGQWLPAASKAPLLMSDGRAVTQALARIDLVALAIAEGDLWRLTASYGRLRLDDLGPYETLRDRLDSFSTTPTDPALAAELGARLLPDDVAHRTDDPLYVVVDRPLAALPFVALRRGGEPVIALRPVVRAPRLPVASACAPRPSIHGAVVLADARGDLPDARRESSSVAALFGTIAHVGEDATSTALFATQADSLLHVAVHADIDAGGGSLRLHDRSVSAPEITANKLGPALVVLSACSTATALDPELAGSLSTAFLAAGSGQVIATLRPVSDRGAFELTRRFYDARGADDPVRVLAAIQADLARTGDKEWPDFAVFGRDVCTPPS
jgi:tetratricopeptide (TPR) repeat protein